LTPDRGVGEREVGDRGRAEQDQRYPAVERQRADRDRQRRQPEPGDQQAVDQAGHRSGGQHDREDRQHRPVPQPQVAEQGAGHAERRGHRQVDLAADHDQRHRQCHDRDLAGRDAGVEQVRRGQELRRLAGPGDDDHGDHDSEAGLPPDGPPR
jgi:hypothetical protein